MIRSCLFAILFSALFSCNNSRENRVYDFRETTFGQVPQPESNIATELGVALGKKLFFDPILSSNGKISCATCHLPQLAFSDGMSRATLGVSGKVLTRHSPALFNLAWMNGTFWDGGAKNLESQVFGPLTHPDEMAADLKETIRLLNAHPEYPALFREVWKIDSITTQELARALAQYERTLISDNSKYDKWKRGEAELSEIELKGYSIYKQKCAQCHTEGLFTDNNYHNNGLDSSFENREEELIHFGRYRIANDSNFIGAFKTPSLRNLGFTAPYMHDGRFENLDQVLDHYNSGIKSGSVNLDSLLLKDGNSPGFRISPEEKEVLKDFLRSLNDSSFVERASERMGLDL